MIVLWLSDGLCVDHSVLCVQLQLRLGLPTHTGTICCLLFQSPSASPTLTQDHKGPYSALEHGGPHPTGLKSVQMGECFMLLLSQRSGEMLGLSYCISVYAGN